VGAILVGVRLASQQDVAVEGAHDVGLAVSVLVLFLADADAGAEEALDLGAPVAVLIELLSLLEAVCGEVDHELVDPVSVFVLGLALLHPSSEECDAVEAPVTGRVGFAAGDGLAALVVGDDVDVSVAGRVLLEADPEVVLEEDRGVEASVLVRVLLLRGLRAVRVESRDDVGLAVSVLVELDGRRAAVEVGGPAIEIAVEVRVFFEAGGLVAVVVERGIGLAVGVAVVELETRPPVAEGDEAVLRAVAVGVLVLAGRSLPVLGEEGPDVDGPIEVRVALGAQGEAIFVVDELVVAAVLVGVCASLCELFGVVVEELARRAGAMSARPARPPRAVCRTRGKPI
jgi:hypothetical protein